jgi:hypothetical protein
VGLYRVNNAASGAAAAPVKVTTSTAIKTLMQLKSAGPGLMVVEWGISFDGSAAATPFEVELCDTATVAATSLTAYVANDVTVYNGPPDAGVTAGGLTLGTGASGFNTSGGAEGTVAAPVRSGDLQLVAPTTQYVKQFPLGQGFWVPAANYLRIRVTGTPAVSAYCYVIYGIGGD